MTPCGELLYDKTGHWGYNKDTTMDHFLTVQDVAKKLRVSQRSVMRYIKAKKLVASKMGQWRIKESDLDRFFKTNINNKRT